MSDDSDCIICLWSYSSSELIDAMSFIAPTDSQCDRQTDRQAEMETDGQNAPARSSAASTNTELLDVIVMPYDGRALTTDVDCNVMVTPECE